MQRIFLFQLIVLLHLPLRSQTNAPVDSNQNLRIYPVKQKLSYYEPYIVMIGIRYAEQISFDSIQQCYVSEGLKKVSDPARFRDYYFSTEEIAAIKSNPAKLLDPKLSFQQNIPPVSEELPDGEYILYYANVPYHESEHVLRYRNDIIAARFHLLNQQLHGDAFWLSPAGDTLRKGTFVHGKRNGTWSIRIDYRTFQVHYSNGVLNGDYTVTGKGNIIREKGHYTKGVADGEWFFYYSNGQLRKHFFVATHPDTVRNTLIRQNITNRVRTTNVDDYWLCDYVRESFFVHFDILNPEDEITYYDDTPIPPDESFRNCDFDDDCNNIEGSSFQTNINGMNHLIDSFGYRTYYDGVYEEFHKNGRLYMRFTVNHGMIDEPDTIFWDNGNPMNIVSDFYGMYTETVLTPEGKIMYINYYDKNGEPIEWLCNKKIYSRVELSRKPMNRQQSYDHLFLHYEQKNTPTLDSIIIGNKVLTIERDCSKTHRRNRHHGMIMRTLRDGSLLLH